MKQKIEEYILKNKENMQEDIQQLVHFESINGRFEENRDCLAFFLSRAREMGFSVKMTKTEDVGVIEMGSGDQTLGILVHLDVVATGDPGKWTDPPFSGAVHDGCIWGRGTVDDKGAAVMSLYAMKAVAESGIPLTKKIWLIVGTSEESNWTDIENFKREFPMPDCGFSPDGEFPIYNAENGYVDIELAFYSDGNKGILAISAGESTNTIPSLATLTLEDGTRIVKHGVSAHSSIPEAGENAIIKLGKALYAESGTVYQFARFLHDYYGQNEDGRTLCPASADECACPTTVAPTVLRYVKQDLSRSDSFAHVSLNLNIRQRPGTALKDILHIFEPLAPKYGFQFEVIEYLEPMLVSEELPFLKIMQKTCEEYGICSEFRPASGTTYAKSMPNFVSWGPVFLEDPACAHMEDERLSLDTMLLATKLYAHFLSLYETEDTHNE